VLFPEAVLVTPPLTLDCTPEAVLLYPALTLDQFPLARLLIPPLTLECCPEAVLLLPPVTPPAKSRSMFTAMGRILNKMREAIEKLDFKV